MGCIKCKRAIPEGAIYCPWCGKKQQPERRKRAKRPNGTGSVYKRSDVTTTPWTALAPGKLEVSRGVFERVVVGSYATRAEAELALAEYIRNPSAYHRDTFKDVYDRWNAHKFPTISASMVNCYKSAYSKCEQLHAMPFAQIRRSDMQRVIDDMADAGASASAIHHVRVLLSSLYGAAMQDDIVQKDYSQFIEIPPVETTEKQAFTTSELRRIERAAAACVPYADYILIMCYTGYRIGEFVSLTADRYDAQRRVIAGGGNKTAAGARKLVPVHRLIAPYVDAAVARGGETIFADIATGKKLTADAFRTRYYDALEAIGLRKLSPHATRRTFATMCSAAGLRQEDMIRMMGHASFDITASAYIKQEAETLVRAIDKIA